MAESYIINAVLRAKDEGFSAGLKAAEKQTTTFGQRMKAGFGFGVWSAIGQKAVNGLQNEFSSMMSQVQSSQAAWKTFEGNMLAVHGTSKKTRAEIQRTRGVLQEYAQATIYSSSDMATTFSQLDAVGIKSAENLVTAFGGLASAAENPTQAMKTLSQQGTQMAAKPKVAWQDFKLMLEQTPAGIAMVAKEMGMSTGELVAAVQDGKIKTEDFFKAVEKVGNSDAMKKQAMQFKTVSAAMDGLRETAANRLLPAWNVVSGAFINGISNIIDMVGKIDGDKLAKRAQVICDNIGKYIKPVLKVGGEVAREFGKALKSIISGLTGVESKFGSTSSVKSWSHGVESAGNALKSFAKYLQKHGKTIGQVLPKVLKLAAAYKGFKIVSGLVSPMMGFTKAILSLSKGGLKSLAAKLFGVGTAEGEVATTSAAGSVPVKDMAIAFLALGAGVLLASGGLLILASAAVKLASAGPGAVATMFGLIAALAGLAYGASLIGPALAGAAPGFISFGAGLLLAGAGLTVAAFGVKLLADSAIRLASAGPAAIGTLAGMSIGLVAFMAVVGALAPLVTAGGLALLVFGAALVVIGLAVYIAAAGIAKLSPWLPVIAVSGGAAALAMVKLAGGLIAIGGASLVAGPGLLLAGAGAMVLAAGMLLLMASLSAVNSQMKSISSLAMQACGSLKNMTVSINAVKSGLSAIASKAQEGYRGLKQTFTQSAADAKSSGLRVGKNFSSGVASGMATANTKAQTSMARIKSTLSAGSSGAYTAGVNIGRGLALGMQSQLGLVRIVAAQLAAAADAAIRAKAKIHSPSRVTRADGEFMGAGLVLGLKDKIASVRDMSRELLNSSAFFGSDLAFSASGAMELRDDCSYSDSFRYTIEVPVEIDGKTVAKATAPYEDAIQKKRERHENRKKGNR